MGKKRKKQKKIYSHKIAFWNRILKSDSHTEDINTQPNVEVVNQKYELLPSSKALIYSSELDYMARCIQDCPNIETGGQLYGAWTASGVPRVIYVLGPGPRANHQTTFFNQDIEYLETIGAKLKEYGLQHIGEWHSHHRLGLPCPSGHDAQTMQNGIVQLNLNRLLLCIGSISDRGIVINPFNFARDAQFINTQWEMINSYNRLREVIDADLGTMLHHPRSVNYVLVEPYITPQRTAVSSQAGCFSLIENRQAFKQIIDSLKNQKWVKEVIPQINSSGIVSLKIITRTFAEIITFPTDFPNSPFEIERMGLIENTSAHYTFKDEWILCSSIQQVFTENYNLHLRKHQ